MSDRGNQPGGEPPDPLSDLEDQEHHRKKLAEEARKEQEHRAEGAPGAVAEDDLTVGHDWTPPPEMSQMEPGRKAIWRVLGFFLFLFVGYFLFRWTTQFLFTPRLVAGNVSVPTDIVSPDEAITLGVWAHNESGNEGSAYALLIMEDGTEVVGPTVAVPGRDSVLVPVRTTIPPGDHVTSLALYDAGQEDNPLLGATHGLLIRSGSADLHVADARVARAGDSIAVDLVLDNRTNREERITTVLVFTPDPETSAPIEVELDPVVVPASRAHPIRLTIPRTAVPPGRYHVAVVAVSPSGAPTGDSQRGIPFVNTPEE